MPSSSMSAVDVHSSAIAIGMISTKGMVLVNASVFSVGDFVVFGMAGWLKEGKKIEVRDLHYNFSLRVDLALGNQSGSVIQPDSPEILERFSVLRCSGGLDWAFGYYTATTSEGKRTIYSTCYKLSSSQRLSNMGRDKERKQSEPPSRGGSFIGVWG